MVSTPPENTAKKLTLTREICIRNNNIVSVVVINFLVIGPRTLIIVSNWANNCETSITDRVSDPDGHIFRSEHWFGETFVVDVGPQQRPGINVRTGSIRKLISGSLPLLVHSRIRRAQLRRGIWLW